MTPAPDSKREGEHVYSYEAGRHILRDGRPFVALYLTSPRENWGDIGPTEADAFVKAVVTAVNSHAALVSALRACVSALEAVNADLDADLGSIDHEPDSTLDNARAALRAAGEEV